MTLDPAAIAKFQAQFQKAALSKFYCICAHDTHLQATPGHDLTRSANQGNQSEWEAWTLEAARGGGGQ